MKKLILLSLFSLTFLTSCDFIKGFTAAVNNASKTNITFVKRNGEADEVIQFDKFSDFSYPEPVKANCSFLGWYQDPFLEAQSLSLVTSDKTLYAGYSVNKDYLDLIATNEVKSSVFTYYEGATSNGTTTTTQGTGFCFDEDQNYYYCLTNNHVVMDRDDKKWIVLDDDTEIRNYRKTLIDPYKTEITEVYKDPNYDLAVLRIKKGNYSLGVAKFSVNTLNDGDIVFSYGSPNGKRHTLSGGIYLGDKEVTISDDQTDILFDVHIHSAEIYGGSSGGPLFNELGEVIGVNYAGSEDKFGNFVWGASVPLVKVYEFLNESNYVNS